MVIITDGNGNIQSPTIPENVYQGSNLANEVVFLAPLPQTNSVTITFNLPNGLVTKQHLMTPYSSVPSEYDLSGWVFRLTKDITAFSGRVNFQIKVYSATNYENVDDSTQIMASCQGSFNVQKGVVSLPSGEPDEDTFEEILTYLSTLTDMVTSQLMPYNEDFSYKKDGMTQKDGKFYISKVNNNQGNSLSNTTYWEEIDITSMINTAIAEKQDTLVSGTNIKTINNQSILGSGNLDINGLFYCTINTTTFSEITTAINAGKLPICIYNDKVYKLSDIGSSSYYFNNTDLTDIRRLSVTSSNSWNLVGIDVENSARKVTSLSSSSTDAQYPSAKLLYDQLQLKQDTLSSAQLDAVNSGIDSTKVGQIATNTSDISTINLKIPSSASSSNKMTVRNEVVGSVDLSINSSTYVITIQCKDVDGNNIGTAQTIDLPLESIVTSATYYNSYTYNGTTYTKVIVIELSTTTIPTIVPVADLVAGLQSEITSQNKLASDLVDDTNQTHKFVTASEKSQITTNKTAISNIKDGTTIDSFGDVETALAGKVPTTRKVNNKALSSDITLDASDVGALPSNTTYVSSVKSLDTTATTSQSTSSSESISGSGTITLHKVSKTGSYDDLLNKPTIPTKTSDLSNDSGFITKSVSDLSNYTPTSSLASVATSGSYNDLSNTPTIPTIVANPTLAGTESDLTGLEVDGTKYKVPTGGGSAGVSSLGGATGAITLGSNLSISNNILNASSTIGTTDLLWTNPNPTSDFAAQTLSVDLIGYTMFGVAYKIEKAWGSSAGVYMFGAGLNSMLYWPNVGGADVYTRRFDNSDITKIVVSNQSTMSGTTDNGKIIPLYIYGIK